MTNTCSGYRFWLWICFYGFPARFWKCSECMVSFCSSYLHYVSGSTVFLLDFGNVPSVWYPFVLRIYTFLWFYGFSVRFWKCSECMVSFCSSYLHYVSGSTVFLLDFAYVPNVWYPLFFVNKCFVYEQWHDNLEKCL